ncbi:SWIM zinc finger family protein [Streptomyces sp. NPDC051913]|uniref:SWIM zinc finger family protein n=1 Tax=Streptomyces sp. NPDC051913 TaxID=3365676 RepID=UPI0037CF2239
MTARPADEARRALREAREARQRRAAEEEAAQRGGHEGGAAMPRRSSDPVDGGAGAEQDVPLRDTAGAGGPTDRGPEPQDAYGVPDAGRVETRAGSGVGDPGQAEPQGAPAVGGTQRAAPDSGSGVGEGPAGAAENPAGAADAADGSVGEDPPARPADRAREALRAARAEARRAVQVEGVTEAAASRRHTSQRPAPRTPGSPPGGRGGGRRARDLRALIGDAFRMPEDGNEPTEPGDGDPQAVQGGSAGPASSYGETPTETSAAPAAPSPDPATAHTSTPPTPATSTPPRTPAEPRPFATPSDSPTSTPRHPRSMAAPGRDGELRRTFPAFGSRAPGGEHGFAETWWGNAWVTALEEGALDAKRLARGRGYAEQGNVDAITVTPGLVLAYVQGSRPRPYRVQVRLRTLDDEQWGWFLDAAAERPGHIAALLDKEMPHSLAEGRVRLLPGPGELDPHCSCPDRGHPCKHAAALCYQTARLLDADPFVLLLLRGRGERELLDTLSRLSAARAARAAQEKGPAPLPGVRATEVLTPRQLPPLPAPLPVPAHPEQSPVYPAAPGGPDPFALDQLATDAAARAHALLGTGRDPVAELTLWQDAVRLAAARPGSGLTATTRSLYASLASAADRTPSDLARAVAAWRQGGFEGLAVLEEPWDPPAGRFDRARPLLLAADLPAFRPWRNHLTHPRGHVQLRLGRDGLWYAYESDPGADDWWPRGTPDLDPVGALTGLGASAES